MYLTKSKYTLENEFTLYTECMFVSSIVIGLVYDFYHDPSRETLSSLMRRTLYSDKGP